VHGMNVPADDGLLWTHIIYFPPAGSFKEDTISYTHNWLNM
jgi:hypothetical protein